MSCGKKQPNLEVIVNLYKVFGIDAETLLDSVAGANPKIRKIWAKMNRLASYQRPVRS
jgi:hypothetical protein